MRTTDLITLHKAIAWAEVKGALEKLIAVQGSNTTHDPDEMRKLDELQRETAKFVKRIEDNGWQE